MARLFYNKNQNDVVMYNLPEGSTSIGRLPENHVVLADKSVSKKHALITVQGDDTGDLRVQIADLHSTNGTFVNRRKITYRVLEDKDEIRIGNVILTYSDH